MDIHLSSTIPIEPLILRISARMLARRLGNCLYPRHGLELLVKILLVLPIPRKFKTSDLPELQIREPLVQKDWLARWARLPQDSLARVIETFVHKGDIVCDVGAFTGWYTYLMAVRVGKTGLVHSFEPNPWLRSPLQLLCSTLPNVKCHFVAAGSTNEREMNFYVASSPGQSSLAPLSDAVSIVKVPVRRLDQELSNDEFGRCSFVKIDVEGYEAEVLKGIDSLLLHRKRGKPRPYLYVEMTEAVRAAEEGCVSEVFTLLRQGGYQVYMVPTLTWHSDVPLKHLQTGPEPMAHGWVDALAVPEERQQELKEAEKAGKVQVVASY